MTDPEVELTDWQLAAVTVLKLLARPGAGGAAAAAAAGVSTVTENMKWSAICQKIAGNR